MLPALLSLVLTIAAIVLAFVPTGAPVWIAPMLTLASWVASVMAVKIRTRPLDLIANGLAIVATGVVMDHFAQQTVPYFLIASLVIFATYAPRTTFITKMGYVKLPWYEAVMAVPAIGAYVYANIHTHAGWTGWTALSLPAFFAGFTALGVVKDIKSFKAQAGKEYAAKEGTAAPDFKLPDQEGKEVSLGTYKGKQLVLLLFVRGDWCPSCHIMLRVYEKNAGKFREKNVIVMAIGPDPVGVNREMVRKLNIDYRILADEKQEALKAYGVTYQESHAGANFEVGIPMPASILVDKNGIVRYISRADRAGEFLNPMKIFSVLETLEA